jgi:hypothetical protein
LPLGHGGFLLVQFPPESGFEKRGVNDMGLDCYWVKPGETKSAPLDFDPPLCFEDELDWQTRREGWAVFPAGRRFQYAIRDITGVSLRACLTTSAVLQIAERLDAFAAQMEAVAETGLPVPPSRFRRMDGSPVPGQPWEEYDAEVYRDIARMFRAYGEAGYELAVTGGAVGYDLCGKKPTAPQGEHFHRSSWNWPPIVDLCEYFARKETRPCKDWYGSECYGNGLNAKQSKRLALRLEQLLATDLIAAYSNRFVDFRLECSEDTIRKFVDFLKTCGGFEIM